MAGLTSGGALGDGVRPGAALPPPPPPLGLPRNGTWPVRAKAVTTATTRSPTRERSGARKGPTTPTPYGSPREPRAGRESPAVRATGQALAAAAAAAASGSAPAVRASATSITPSWIDS